MRAGSRRRHHPCEPFQACGILRRRPRHGGGAGGCDPPAWHDVLGSNGIAIAPKLSADHHALLLINPHVTFYVRDETQMSSDRGLDAYGASTWGRFFICQGFNEHIGWMHTSTGVDARSPSATSAIAVPFTSSRWGSLASFGAHTRPGTRKYYGNDGNSFVAVVDFGPRVSARAIHVGGASGNPGSPHFTDQATRYVSGDLRTVYFWPDQLERHTVRVYHPGH